MLIIWQKMMFSMLREEAAAPLLNVPGPVGHL